MGFSRTNALNQALDVAGSFTVNSAKVLTDESAGLGQSQQTGVDGYLTGSSPTITLTAASATFTAASVGNFVTITGSGTGANNSTHLIVAFSSPIVVDLSIVGGAADALPLPWTERAPYNIEDDLNFERTDRAAIKGVAYDTAVTPYSRPSTSTTLTPMNLEQISGKTLDAKALIVNRTEENAPVEDGYTVLVLSGAFQYADAVDQTGYPINDGFDAGNLSATYCEIIDPSTEAGVVIPDGYANAGQRIYGIAQQGSQTEGLGIEIAFYRVALGDPITTANPYTWNAGPEMPTQLDLFLGYRTQMDDMGEADLRVTMVNGLIGDSGAQLEINDIRQTIGTVQGDTDLGTYLTNQTPFYIFDDLSLTPTVVEALNVLNLEIGNRDYTGAILTDGYTITASLQQLSDAIAENADVLRTIERLTVNAAAGVAHTFPDSLTYDIDVSNNGRGMWLYWRGVLRDPGPVVDGNDYEETSTSSFTPYATINSGDHINYFIITETNSP